MNVRELFEFLIKDYGFSHEYQQFENCYNGNWVVQTHSFYNDNGCFTIHYLCQKNELNFYYASQFSSNLEELCERMVDVRSIEPTVWDRYSKIWIFNRPFFWWNNNKVLIVFAQALNTHLHKNNEFFGIKIK